MDINNDVLKKLVFNYEIIWIPQVLTMKIFFQIDAKKKNVR